MFRLHFLLAACAIVAVAGCAKPTPPTGGEYPARAYGRVVSLTPNTTEILAMLDLEKALVGRTASCTFPATIRNVLIVADPKPDLEKIAVVRADMIVVDQDFIDPATVESAKAMGADIKVVKINSLKEWEDAVYDLGNTLMVQATASKKVDDLRASINAAKADAISPAPRVLVATGGGKPWIAGKDGFQADVVRAAGGDAIGPDGVMFAQVNPEQILQWNPDIVFVSDDPASYENSPVWKATAAGKARRFVKIDPDVLLRAGGRVSSLIRAMSNQLRNHFAGG